MAGCGGGGERQDAGATEGDFEVAIVKSDFAPVQRLAKTRMMRVGVENSGAETIPNLAITVKLLGEEGENARQAFGYRDPQKNLSLPDRPVWVLDLGYPTLAGSDVLGGAGTASPRTFAFGELEPGETAEAVWRLTPVKAGSYRISYEVSPDIYGVGSITDSSGGVPEGQFAVRVLKGPERQRVTGDGRVVPIRVGQP